MNVDDLINRVARDLTEAEPSAELSREVQARIAAVPRRRPWPRWIAPAIGVAAAAVVILAVAIPRGQKTAPPIVQAPERTQTASRPVAGTVVDSTEAASNTAVVSAQAPRRRTPRPASINPVLAAWQERAVAALPGVRPLAIDRIEPASIQPSTLGIPLMEVEPLSTTPLSVTPVGSSSGG